MPRYFFCLRDENGNLQEDPEGQEFSDLAGAEENAMVSAKEILAEELLRGKPVRTGLAFEILDENHKLVLRFPFAFAAERSGTSLNLELLTFALIACANIPGKP
ncbi:hypothetical protein [Mesorhizobium sp. B2-4-19]|uniref:DUF6894 family protein n=1 Tax=Mesorhizobium sp. B2-4-19 TaxID=2589930 RepID=UPI0015E2ED85|nr:hypothetical protein [Mesorhizobium sp. B2-4-19]